MKSSIKRLTVSAILIALSTVLSVIPAIQLPFGGKATILSMLPVMLITFKYDFKWGMLSCFVYSFIQLALSFAKVLSWGVTPLVFVVIALLDYILAYTVLGFAGVFKNKGEIGQILGIVLALVLRFIMHFISGIALWDTIAERGVLGAVIYSLGYNATYMLPELIFTVIAVVILMKTNVFKKIINY